MGKSLFLQFRYGLFRNIPLLHFVCSYGPLYFYITSFPFLIKKALIFRYTYNMCIYTTSSALDSHVYSSDLLNTWCAISRKAVISPIFPAIELIILLYPQKNLQESPINSDI